MVEVDPLTFTGRDRQPAYTPHPKDTPMFTLVIAMLWIATATCIAVAVQYGRM
jgi:hypothetical protein